MADATTPGDRSKAINTSYSQASAWLVAQHKAEFDAKRKEILAAAGIDWNPPLTQAQKDEALLREIAARNPEAVQSFKFEGALPKGSTTDAHS